MRRRKIQKYGNTWIIKLEPADIKDFEIAEGDEVDIDDLGLLENRGEHDKHKIHKDKRKNT